MSSLTAFTRKVKAYRKKHPSVSYAKAQQEVKKQNNKPARRKTSTKKKKAARRRVSGVRTLSKSHVDRNRFKNVDIQIGSVSKHVSTLKKALQRDYGKQSEKLLVTKKKPARRKIQKKMQGIASQLRRLG
jgi:hypothetical protein